LDIVLRFIIEYSSLKDFGPCLEMVIAGESSSRLGVLCGSPALSLVDVLHMTGEGFGS